MEVGGPYSSLKVFHHQDRLEQLRRGEQIVPAQLQIILSDLCNHDCLPAGTLIETPGGSVPVESIRKGDRITGPDGRTSIVNYVVPPRYDRGPLYEIEVDGHVITTTGNHPFLTQRGWIEARDLTISDCAHVRDASGHVEKQIASIELVEPSSPVVVYNFHCPPAECYFANGVLVHNCSFCSYRWSGYTSNELFTAGAELAKFGTNNPNRMLPFEKVIEVLDDCKEMGVGAIQYSVWSEERIPVVCRGNCLQTHPIGEFIDRLFGEQSPDGRHEERDVSDLGYRSFAIDDRGRVILDTISKVYRHKASEPLYEVILADGRRVVVTASHSLNVVRGQEIHRIPVAEIGEGELIACASWFANECQAVKRLRVPLSDKDYAANSVNDEVSVSSELIRLLGYFTAEGCTASRSTCFIFGNGPREDGYRNDVARCCESVFGLKASIDGRRVYIHSVRVQSFILETCKAGGVQGRRAIPWIVWGLSRELKLEYLRGLFSGDGNFRQTATRGVFRNSLHLATCNRHLAMEVAELIRQVGARATITYDRIGARRIEGRKLEPSDRWSVNVSDRESLLAMQPVLDGLEAVPRYADSVYSKAGMHKKREWASFGESAVAIPVKSIRIADELGRPMVYDITVAGTHRFLTSAGVGCANTGGGEPTVHPRHREIFKATVDRGLQFALVSNGAVFRKASSDTPSTVDLLLQASWVRFSIDAGTAETYSTVRRIPKSIFSQVVENIRSLVVAKAAAGRGPIIGLGFVVTKENWREVVEAAKLAKSIGVDNLRISAVFQPDDDAYFSGFHADAAELCKEAAALSDGSFRVFNRFSDRLENLHDKHPDYQFCGYQQFNCYLGGDQSLYRCCNTAYSLHGLIGSIRDARFKDVWLSEQKRLKIDGFDAHGCPRCMFSNVNKTINYALGEGAEHVNFV